MSKQIPSTALLLLIGLLLGLLAARAQGRELQQQARMRLRARTTTTAEDEALAEAAAAAAAAAVAEEATAVEATAVEASLGVAAVSPCTSTQLEWPAGSGYCWIKRDSGGAQTGPGRNVFKSANVAVNADGQLVLTILNPQNKVSKSSCGEVFLTQSLGYGDYTWVVATNPSTIDHRLVGAPFIYDTDVKEFDFEFARWGSVSANNSQMVVQPYTTNPPVRYNINTVNTTHRMRWTPASVVFESFLPDSLGGGLINSWTYTGPNSFVPATERVHINYWISSRVNAIPQSSTYVSNCFKFCAQTDLATCSSALGSKPRCSATKAW